MTFSTFELNLTCSFPKKFINTKFGPPCISRFKDIKYTMTKVEKIYSIGKHNTKLKKFHSKRFGKYYNYSTTKFQSFDKLFKNWPIYQCFFKP